jgi:hypothetical protein
MVEKEKDLVARLRKESNGVTVNLNPWPTMREAADEIEKLRAEIVRLEAMKSPNRPRGGGLWRSAHEAGIALATASIAD